MDWTGVLDWWTGLVNWTGGLDWWTGLLDWAGGLDWWSDTVMQTYSPVDTSLFTLYFLHRTDLMASY